MSWAIDFRENPPGSLDSGPILKGYKYAYAKKEKQLPFSKTHYLGGRGRLAVYFRIDFSFLFFSFLFPFLDLN